ncbi:L,D-transpeptidase [Variovorax sp. J22P271]|uniref:L,D-transpeptidase n=1 Tax=Variovorax davisae TaxID=3053515 RepID=UPI0025754A13|nr:L,D-transpeptidase [Variovorax sp. J22P271]MDM0032179.1 L,D-transpeptidase [Variovorax sp. J22P271]
MYAGLAIIALVAAAPARAQVSLDALLSWVRANGDNQGAAFVVVDKRAARVHVYRNGTERASSPVLVGLARGDLSVAGIGERKMQDILPDERTTPAGRFVSEPGTNLQHEDIVRIDYDAAVSMHRVRANQPAERRMQRLASLDAQDHRITYGALTSRPRSTTLTSDPSGGSVRGFIYVLPEASSFKAVFESNP